MIRRRQLLTTVATGLALISCEEAPKKVEKKKDPPKPPEPIAGRKAFYQMYTSARTWAPDAQPLQLVSVPISEIKPGGGKYGAWQCMFVSPSKSKLKVYTYSVVEAGGNLHQGVFSLNEESFSGARGQAKPFLVAALKTETDEIFAAAMKKGERFSRKNPAMPVNILLEYTPRFPQPAWRVIWGESISSSPYSLFYDAVSGEFLTEAH